MPFIIHFLELSRLPDLAPSFLNVSACLAGLPSESSYSWGAKFQPALYLPSLVTWPSIASAQRRRHHFWFAQGPHGQPAFLLAPLGVHFVPFSQSPSALHSHPFLLSSFVLIVYTDDVQLCTSSSLFSAVSGLSYCPFRLMSITDSSLLVPLPFSPFPGLHLHQQPSRPSKPKILAAPWIFSLLSSVQCAARSPCSLEISLGFLSLSKSMSPPSMRLITPDSL